MEFEWDERKRQSTLRKHGIDFVRARRIFDGSTIEAPDERRPYGEHRIGAYGEVEGDILYIVYTWRDKNRRLISARKAGHHEREIYYACHRHAGK